MEDVIRRIVDQTLSRRANTQVAVVSAYDPDRHAVKATLQPQGVETGWAPIATSHVGNGFGLAIGPEIGDQIIVGFHEGDIDSPFMMGRLHSDAERPPRAEAGEIVFQTKSGAVFKFSKDGSVSLNTNGKAFTLDAGGADIHINSANLFHNAKNIGDTHEHTGIVPGDALTGPPA